MAGRFTPGARAGYDEPAPRAQYQRGLVSLPEMGGLVDGAACLAGEALDFWCRWPERIMRTETASDEGGCRVTPHSDPGYYSAHSPALTPRSTNTCHVPVTRVTPRGAPRDSLSPGSVYSDTSYSGQGHPPPPSVTQDPTPSSTFREEDELLDSIVQWEKY